MHQPPEPVDFEVPTGLVWIERGPQGERTYTWDPQAGVGRRLGVRLVSWLPIEWML